ncbi:hypothetical protein IB259_29235 [Achromobacter sp. ACM04]|uniref:hypothetical protein n=1 Tax=Achromobacter sp. ACM04 TaxID=2769312 RepID=UPI00177B40F7|nr:hypothetical protein [Achromobacter sp. ACM04]MBD9423369.1 hypothetical protein [Achromobacter sp. ACM04]
MAEIIQPIQTEFLDYDPALPYVFDANTRALYAFVLRSRYRESGSWPVDGLPVPEESAHAYMNDPERDVKTITKSGSSFTITDA